MLKKIIFIIFVTLLFSPYLDRRIKAGPIDKPTEVYIIGTVHIGTNSFDSDTLLNILNKINPDVILIECDTSYMTTNFEFKEEIKYAFLETSAITEYLKNKEVQVRPFDIAGGDIFFDDPVRKINESDFFNDIQSLTGDKSKDLSGAGVSILEKFYLMMSIAEEMSNAKISYINSPEGSMKIDTINYYSYVGLGLLINAVPELLKYRSYWDAEYDNWNKRNDAMLVNILKYEGFFEGKKIVVLCGFAHKNFLKNELLKHKHILTKEYWE
ncbi:MAG: TraB/GumN family protein [Bacteroidota bacterium]|nr:TraB/GumN family protein [Bacteroidota bacterium]